MVRRSSLILCALSLAVAAAFVWIMNVVSSDVRRHDASSSASIADAPARSASDPAASSALAENRSSANDVDAARLVAAGAVGVDSAAGARGARDQVIVIGTVRIPAATPADESAEVVAAPLQYEWPTSYRASVGRDGSFRLELPTEMSHCELSVAGRYLYSPQPLRVKLSAPPSPIVLEPLLGGSIRGRFVLPLGEPELARTRDTTRVEIGTSSSFEAWTRLPIDGAVALDEQLEFELRHLAPGTSYSIRARPPGFVAIVRGDLVVKAGTTESIEIPLAIGARITGRVQDESGAPLEGVHFSVARKGSEDHAFEDKINATSEADGTFDCAALLPGDITLTATSEGFASTSVAVGTLADGEVRRDIVFVLGRGIVVAGRVQWPDGKPAAACEIDVHATRTWKSANLLEFDFPHDRSASTGDDGRFSIGGLAHGPFVVTAHCEPEARGSSERGNEAPASADAIVRSDAEWIARAEVAESGARELVLTLEPGRSIHGRVVDDLERPLEFFTVEARATYDDDNFARSEKTVSRFFADARGEFELSGLHDGVWIVSVRSASHARSTERTCVLPREASKFEFVLPRGASIAGTVVDADGRPVERPVLSLVRDWDGRERDATQQSQHSSDDDGRFQWKDLAPGSYRLVASTTGMASSTPIAIELVAGQKLDGLTLALRSGGRLIGEVFDFDGRPDPRRALLLMPRGRLGSQLKLASDAAGRFEIEHITPGTYELCTLESDRERDAHASEDAARVASFVNRTARVKIVDGETAHVTLGAPPRSPVRVFGAVTIGGKPLANTSLNVARRLTGGQWAAHDVATRSSGEYEVVLEEPGDWGFFLRSNSVSSGRHVAIPAGASYELDVALPSGSISGRVLGANGEPLPVVAVRLSLDASVAELSSDAAGGVVATDVAGHFRFEGLPAGTYALATQGLNRSESEPVHGELHKRGLVLAAGAALEGIELKLEKAGRIEGLVFDATGSPAPNARVFVRDQHGEIASSSGWSSTSASGRFEVAGLSPGSYTVFARTDALCSNESAPIVIASDDSAHVELTLQPSALLRVIVDDEHGHPTGAMIGVVDAHGRDFGPSNPANDMSGESGEGDDMSRTFGPLPPGTYSVSATNHDKVSVRADTQLAPGEQRTVTLRFGG